jgi:N-acyl-D-aspartate/D-glutamate deacylase
VDPAFRARFRKQWQNRWMPRAYHRNLRHSQILACPDASVVGKSFAEVAAERGAGVDPLDVFFDLVAEHGKALRWYTVMGNDRPEWLEWIVRHPDILIGFSDAGAHLRNMAYYNFPLRMLKLVRDAEQEGRAFMSVERAVHRLTAELADWLGLDVARVVVGARADLVVVDPAGLDAELETLHEQPMPEFDDLPRLVRRNDRAVRCVLVHGRVAYAEGVLAPQVGRERGFGEVLVARHGASAPTG